MVTQNITVNITATENASGILKKVEAAAKGAASGMQKAGKDGEAGMKQIERGAQSADTRLRTLERTMLSVGAAAGTVALGVIKASAAYQNQERQIDALNRMYGQGSQEMQRYAEMIQMTTRYSNDAARQSLILLNTLQQNFGMSSTQIEQLLSRATDLAQLHGKSLTEVTQMIQNALRGEAEYIEQLGVTLNQNFVAAEAAARGMGNFISGMTQAEQAAFRFTLLMEQTANAQGAAREAMEGTRGTVSLLINSLQDVTQVVGGALGPVRDLAAEFNQYALWIPLIASQTARMATVLANSARSGDLAANAFRMLSFAISPIGLALTGIVVVGGAVINYFMKQRQAAAEAAAAAEETARTYDMLAEAISRLYLSGEVDAANWGKGQVNALQSFAAEWQRTSDKMIGDITKNDSKWQGIPGLDLIDDLITGASDAALNLISFGNWGEQRRQAREAKRQLVEDLKLEPEDEQAIGMSFQRVLSLADNPYVDQAQLENEWGLFMEGLVAGVNDGTILPDEINEEIDAFFSRFAEQAAKGAADTEKAMADFEQALSLRDLRLDGWNESQIAQLEIFDQLTGQIQAYRDALLSIPEPNTNIGEGLFNYMTGYSNLPDISHLELTAKQMSLVGRAQEEINEAMRSGKYDNEAINSAIGMSNRLFAEGKINGEQYAAVIQRIALNIDQFEKSAFDGAKAGEAIGSVLDNMARKAIESATSFSLAGRVMTEMVKTMTDAVDITNQIMGFQAGSGGIGAMTAGLERALEIQENVKDFIADYRELIGMDSPLASVNLTSLRSEASGLAGEFARATSELENMYRVIVGNTEAIKSQADAIFNWADELIAERGVFSRLDELVEKGLITGQSGVFDTGSQYANAQDAYDSIAISTERIKDNLDAVQAIQSPLIAESMEWQAQLTENLLQQDSGTQRLTLAWMDATSAAQAFQLVQQLTLMQSGELGNVSAQTMETIVQGAITANPLLFDMLESMGVISGTPLDFEINTEALSGAKSELEGLTTEIGYLVDTLREIYDLPPIRIQAELDFGDTDGLYGYNRDVPPIEVPAIPTWQGGGVNGDGTGGSMDIPPVEVPATPVFGDEPMAGIPAVDVQANLVFSGGGGDPTGMYGGGLASIPPIEVPVEPQVDMAAMQSSLSEASGQQVEGPTFTFVPEDSGVGSAVQAWASAQISGPTFLFVAIDNEVSALAGQWASASYNGPTFRFVADDSSVRAAIGRYADGAVIATQYVNIVARTTSAGIGMRHGGIIPAYAHGGRAMAMIEAGEGDNPEIAHFANGGTAVLPTHGVYFVPPMTMITPSNEAKNQLMPSVSLSIRDNIFYGGSRPDLEEWGANSFIPQVADELRRLLLASGE